MNVIRLPRCQSAIVAGIMYLKRGGRSADVRSALRSARARRIATNTMGIF